MIAGHIESILYRIDGQSLPPLIDTLYDGQKKIDCLIGKYTFSHIAKRTDAIDHILYLYLPEIETSTISVDTTYGEFGIVIDSSYTRYDKKWTVLMLVYYQPDAVHIDDIRILAIDPNTNTATTETVRYDISKRSIID